MHRTSTVILLATMLAFQAFLPPTVSGQETAAQTSQGTGTNLKTLSANWRVSIPFVACEKGKPILNVEVPDSNAPAPMCAGVEAPDVLPRTTQSTGKATARGTYEVGTVIVMSASHEKIVLAADSRITRVTTEGRVQSYNDHACKLIQLTPTILFAAAGQVRATNGIPAVLLYDAHRLAKLAARNYQPDARDEQLAGGRLAAIATRWAWDVDFRMHHGFEKGWKPIETLEGVFVGLEPDGDLGFAIAKLDYPKSRAGMQVPPWSSPSAPWIRCRRILRGWEPSGSVI